MTIESLHQDIAVLESALKEKRAALLQQQIAKQENIVADLSAQAREAQDKRDALYQEWGSSRYDSINADNRFKSAVFAFEQTKKEKLRPPIPRKRSVMRAWKSSRSANRNSATHSRRRRKPTIAISSLNRTTRRPTQHSLTWTMSTSARG